MNAKNYMSIENTNALKGIMAIMVLISHIYASSSFQINIPALNFVFGSFLGYVPVSVFFFLSGYGTMFSFRKKGVEYVRLLPRNRLLPLYLISLVMISIYSLVDLLINKNLDVILLLKSLALGGTVIKYGWYLQTIIVLYVLFWVCFSLRIRDNLKILVFCVSVGVLYVSSFALGFEPTWYATAPCMMIGMLWSVFADRVDRIINTHLKKWISIIASLLICALFKISSTLLSGNIAYLFQLTGTSIFFSIAIILFLKGISLCNFITRFLGKISLEIYVTQGLTIILLSFWGLHKINIFLYGLLVVAATILLAISVHPIFNKINKGVRKDYKIKREG